jgi:hypothetical protein
MRHPTLNLDRFHYPTRAGDSDRKKIPINKLGDRQAQTNQTVKIPKFDCFADWAGKMPTPQEEGGKRKAEDKR